MINSNTATMIYFSLFHIYSKNSYGKKINSHAILIKQCKIEILLVKQWLKHVVIFSIEFSHKILATNFTKTQNI
jgi:hypothetical protein